MKEAAIAELGDVDPTGWEDDLVAEDAVAQDLTIDSEISPQNRRGAHDYGHDPVFSRSGSKLPTSFLLRGTSGRTENKHQSHGVAKQLPNGNYEYVCFKIPLQLFIDYEVDATMRARTKHSAGICGSSRSTRGIHPRSNLLAAAGMA